MASRRDERRVEAFAQAAFALIVLLAFAAGGLSGFVSALAGLLICGLVLLAFAAAVFLVMRSRMSAPRRVGISFALLGILLLLIWNVTKAPPKWSKFQATVRSVTAPPCKVEIDYQYQTRGVTAQATRSEERRTVTEAQQEKLTPVTLYSNPANSQQISDRPVANWTRVTAVPVSRRITPTAPYQAVIVYGDLLFPKTTKVTGPVASKLKPGAKLTIYCNPIEPSELSLEPRDTVGGKHYERLGVAILFLLVGGWFTFAKNQWITELAARRAVPPVLPTAAAGPRSASPPKSASPPTNLSGIRETLDRIDWYQFEKIAARILEHMDWNVTRSGGARPDAGADIIARKNGETAVVQCKHWHRIAVTPNILRELLGTKASVAFNAHEAVLFTLSHCTDEATRFAQENRVTVFTGDQIARFVEEIGPEQFPEIVNPEAKFCPKCEAPMVWRRAPTPFWGCSIYPRCTGKIETARAPAVS